MIVCKQLDIFEQQRQERYKAYYNKFYARNLREAEERRNKPEEPDYSISINPKTLGQKIFITPKKRKNESK
jgi:hypothetical protein